jgi:hypothetical protein
LFAFPGFCDPFTGELPTVDINGFDGHCLVAVVVDDGVALACDDLPVVSHFAAFRLVCFTCGAGVIRIAAFRLPQPFPVTAGEGTFLLLGELWWCLMHFAVVMDGKKIRPLTGGLVAVQGTG